MNLAFRQRGVSATGMLAIALIAIFFVTCAIKMAPLYMESLSVKRSMEAAMEEAIDNGESPRKIKEKLWKKFDINRIETLKASKVKVSQKDGITTIDARYEARVPLMFNIDVVMKFEDFIYEFSSRKK